MYEGSGVRSSLTSWCSQPTTLWRAGAAAVLASRSGPYRLADALCLELIELEDAFRAYRQRTEPGLALLAQLHERKAHTFRHRADFSDDGSLRHDASRARTSA